MELTIREIAAGDAEAAGKLSGELGSVVPGDVMRQRIQKLAGRDDHTVYVALLDGTVAGWIDIGIVQHLHGEAYGEIGGLVVSAEHRSAGIGRQLVARAEEWVRERGVPQMLVRSRDSREAAHRFYLREGYRRSKTSAVFSKPLAIG